MPSPRVSVVIPTYYRNDFLSKSIKSALAQSHDDVEVIVVDGSGEGHARPVVEGYDEVTYVAPEAEVSVTEARNWGIRKSSGEYVQLLDDDDRLFNEKFDKQLAVFADAPDVGVVYCGGEFSTGEEFSPNPGARGDVLDLALRLELYSCITSTMLLDQAVLTDIMPLPETEGADDTHWKIELARRTEFEFVDDPLVYKYAGPETRGKDYGNVRALELLFERYEHLYDDHPPSVRRTAKANYYKYKANVLLDDRRWSTSAIHAYAGAFVNRPSLGHLGLFVTSVFGRTGVQWVKSL